jgi:SAM-dependent methyltransferase
MQYNVVYHSGVWRSTMNSNSEHWNSIFSATEESKLGWFEKDPTQTLELLDQIPEWEDSRVFVAGAGTSILVEHLLHKNAELVLNDISTEALNGLKVRLVNENHNIHWLCQDISQPITNALPDIDIWIDRAVLHFLRKEGDIKGYFNNLTSVLKPGGYALFAEFSTAGARKCAGMEVHRYSVEELSKRLGPAFRLVSYFDHVYINPEGAARPYIYALYKRIR